MSNILSHWFYFASILANETLIPSISLYMIGVLLFALCGRFWIMKKIPIVTHIGHISLINIVIAGIYVYTLPTLKIRGRYEAEQTFRLFHYERITSVESICLFSLYAVTILFLVWILMTVTKRKSLNDKNNENKKI